jgi:hypothetical protein
MSKFTVAARDVTGLLARFAEVQRKAEARTGDRFGFVVIQEAGLDGFWLHRILKSGRVREPCRRSRIDCRPAPGTSCQNRPHRRRDAAANLARLLARCAPGVCDGERANPGRRGPSPRLSRAKSPDKRADPARKPHKGPALRPGDHGLRAASARPAQAARRAGDRRRTAASRLPESADRS